MPWVGRSYSSLRTSHAVAHEVLLQVLKAQPRFAPDILPELGIADTAGAKIALCIDKLLRNSHTPVHSKLRKHAGQEQRRIGIRSRLRHIEAQERILA